MNKSQIEKRRPEQKHNSEKMLIAPTSASLAARPMLAAELNLRCVNQKYTKKQKAAKYFKPPSVRAPAKKQTAIKCQAPKKLIKDLLMKVQPSAL